MSIFNVNNNHVNQNPVLKFLIYQVYHIIKKHIKRTNSMLNKLLGSVNDNILLQSDVCRTYYRCHKCYIHQTKQKVRRQQDGQIGYSHFLTQSQNEHNCHAKIKNISHNPFYNHYLSFIDKVPCLATSSMPNKIRSWHLRHDMSLYANLTALFVVLCQTSSCLFFHLSLMINL